MKLRGFSPSRNIEDRRRQQSTLWDDSMANAANRDGSSPYEKQIPNSLAKESRLDRLDPTTSNYTKKSNREDSLDISKRADVTKSITDALQKMNKPVPKLTKKKK